MKTVENNQNPQHNQDKKATNQPGTTPGSHIQDPTKRNDPARRENPVQEPNKQQPHVDPDSTSPEKQRTDPYATDKGHSQKTEKETGNDRNDSGINKTPTGKTTNTTTDSYKDSEANKNRNPNNGNPGREDQRR